MNSPLSYLSLTAFSLLLFVSGCSDDSGNVVNVTEIDGYKLVWNDEFSEEGLPDSENWDYDTGDDGWGNNELQDYTARDPKTARVEDGNLIITASLIERSNSKTYRSARLLTRGKHAWKYGRIEMRAKLPGGTGTWAAFWMLPEVWNYGNGSWPDNGEIDIMEYVGYDPNQVHGTVHTSKRNHMIGTQVGEQVMVPDAETEFYVYALEWNEDSLSVFVNDRKYFTYINEGNGWEYWPFDKKFYLILNLAIGGNWGGREGVDDSIFPVEYVVDYVRVYQLE